MVFGAIRGKISKEHRNKQDTDDLIRKEYHNKQDRLVLMKMSGKEGRMNWMLWKYVYWSR